MPWQEPQAQGWGSAAEGSLLLKENQVQTPALNLYGDTLGSAWPLQQPLSTSPRPPVLNETTSLKNENCNDRPERKHRGQGICPEHGQLLLNPGTAEGPLGTGPGGSPEHNRR